MLLPPLVLPAAALPERLLRDAVLHAVLCAAAVQPVRPLWSVTAAAHPRECRMIGKSGRVGFAVVGLWLLAAPDASAARLRYHYGVLDEHGTTILRPLNNGSPGERLTWSLRWEPYACPPPRATCMVTFRHPCTGRNLVLPLRLPPDLPRMEYRSDRVIYNYGLDTVEVQFFSDGSADVIYNNGLLRAP